MPGGHAATSPLLPPVDADDMLTPAQRVVVDKRLAEAEEDIKAGRVSGPFATVDQLKRHLGAKR
jgi:hypothetical protein